MNFAVLIAVIFSVSVGEGLTELKTEILTPGKSCKRKAEVGDKVSVHYAGRLISNGKEFDSSFKRNQPFTFKLGAGQVIKGWDQGVVGMCIGEKRKLSIPSGLGYGARGAGRDIGPYADLEFDVELVSIVGYKPEI